VPAVFRRFRGIVFKMKDWSGIAVIVLTFLISVLYGSFKDKDPTRMNPRFEEDMGNKKWGDFQFRFLKVLIFSFFVSYILVQFAKWVWMHR